MGKDEPPGLFGIAFVAIGLALMTPAPLVAQTVEQFYRGKTVNMVIGFDVGGGYDVYARLAARFLGDHIPGSPRVVPQNMPGAGGLAAMNHLYRAAAKDGTTIGAVHNNVAIGQIMGSPNIEYDARRFNWMGRTTSTIDVHYVWHSSPTRSYDDLKTRETVAAGTGPSSNSVLLPKLLNAIAGTRIKLIAGFKGTNEANLAMQRGEVEMVIKPWEGVKSENGDWLRDNQIRLIVQYSAGRRHRDLPELPTLMERLETEEQRQIMRIFLAGSDIGRSVLMPPGVPTERVDALRAAFIAMTKDPAFLAEAKKLNLDLDVMSGAELQALITTTFDLEPDVVEKARKLYQ